jgi:hypothetical protein
MTVAVEQLITPEINRPARYLGNEQGTKHKPWDSAIVRWVLTWSLRSLLRSQKSDRALPFLSVDANARCKKGGSFTTSHSALKLATNALKRVHPHN